MYRYDETAKKPIILLVEDNPGHAALIKRAFRDYSLPNEIVHLPDGEEALNYVFGRNQYENAIAPDLVLLDLRMPRVDGLEVLRQIKESPDLSHMPVIVLTTSSSEEDIDKAYEYHVNSYLVKPVDFDDIMHMVEAIGQYWFNYNHVPRMQEVG